MGVYLSILTTSAGTVINEPIALPMLESNKTIRAWVILFLYQPFSLQISSDKFSISWTLGFFKNASIIPVQKPTPINGFIDVIGAIKNEATIVMGFARAINEPRAASPPFQRT